MKHASLFLVLLAGCATHPVPATKAQIDESLTAYIGCLDAAARLLDDGKSEPLSIAPAVRGSCRVEFTRSVDLESQGLNARARLMFRQRAEPRIDDAVFAVLMVRKERAARPTHSDHPAPSDI